MPSPPVGKSLIRDPQLTGTRLALIFADSVIAILPVHSKEQVYPRLPLTERLLFPERLVKNASVDLDSVSVLVH